MEIIWYGHACFKIKGKEGSIVIDPYDPDMMGLKLPKDLSADIAIKTHDHPDHNNLKLVTGAQLQIQGPGEYEVKGLAISGISVFHDTKEGAERGRNTIYNMNVDGVNIVHCGDLGHTLTEDQIAEIGNCDILLIPVGSVFTIDAHTASEVVSQLEPKIVIPMHYGTSESKVELEPIEKFLKEMGAENTEAINKLTTTKDKLPDELQVVVLSKQ